MFIFLKNIAKKYKKIKIVSKYSLVLSKQLKLYDTVPE